MEYIQCTSCSKKYGINDKIRAAVGRAIKCKACQDTFPIIIHDSEAAPKKQPKQQAPIADAAAGWDPSNTMPPSETQGAEKKATVQHHADSEEEDEELAAFMQLKKKKKKQQIYIASGLGFCLLAGILLLWLLEDEASNTPVQPQPRTQQQPQQTKTEKVSDQDNEACRQAAAEQWLIDSTVMYGEYSATEYVKLLTQSQEQSAAVRNACTHDKIIQDILQSATKQLIPAWFEAEVHRLQEGTQAQASPQLGSADIAEEASPQEEASAEGEIEQLP